MSEIASCLCRISLPLPSFCLHIAVFVQSSSRYTKNIAAQVFPLVSSGVSVWSPLRLGQHRQIHSSNPFQTFNRKPVCLNSWIPMCLLFRKKSHYCCCCCIVNEGPIQQPVASCVLLVSPSTLTPSLFLGPLFPSPRDGMDWWSHRHIWHPSCVHK